MLTITEREQVRNKVMSGQCPLVTYQGERVPYQVIQTNMEASFMGIYRKGMVSTKRVPSSEVSLYPFYSVW